MIFVLLIARQNFPGGDASDIGPSSSDWPSVRFGIEWMNDLDRIARRLLDAAHQPLADRIALLKRLSSTARRRSVAPPERFATEAKPCCFRMREPHGLAVRRRN
ncbi:MAG: hypothetical protein WKF77_17220 [Planctomycetaceae bacterium]